MTTAPHLSALLHRVSVARLLVSGALLAGGVLLAQWEALPFELPPFALCLLGAAAASGVYLVVRPTVGNLRRWAWLQLILDVVLATGIVAVTGGPQSIFVFLYILTITAACLILSRQGGVAVGALASLLYAGLVLGRTVVPLSLLVEPTETTALEVASMFTNAGVFLVVAILMGTVAERYHQLRRELEVQRDSLSDLQAFKDLIFESVGSGLIALDRQERVTAFNRAAEEITGLSAVEVHGQPWQAVFDDSICLERVWASIDDAGYVSGRHEIALRRKDGCQVPIGISFWPLRTGAGRLAGLIGVCQDLSQIKQMERRVRQADRLATVGRLAANIAHEIRNPLASVTGAIEALSREVPLREGSARLAEIVLRESARLDRIIKDFLEYARPAALQPLAVNLSRLLDDVLVLLEQRRLSPNVRMVREYSAEIPAQVDPQQLGRAIWHLCLNALDAMREGGELRIGARVSGDEVAKCLEVWVADTGRGISAQDLPQIFELFYSTKAGGSGLGLAMVHRVVQDHGGDIQVRSDPDVGTTFTVSLPQAPASTVELMPLTHPVRP
ncbi:MAG: nitrogen regulation protein NR(II) [Candidatus Methylomirabilia bacterium]